MFMWQRFFPLGNFLKIIFQISDTGNRGVQKMFFISHLNANENWPFKTLKAFNLSNWDSVFSFVQQILLNI